MATKTAMTIAFNEFSGSSNVTIEHIVADYPQIAHRYHSGEFILIRGSKLVDGVTTPKYVAIAEGEPGNPLVVWDTEAVILQFATHGIGGFEIADIVKYVHSQMNLGENLLKKVQQLLEKYDATEMFDSDDIESCIDELCDELYQ